MLEQLRNLSNPPGAFGTHDQAALVMAAVAVLMMFAGPALWAIVYLMAERNQKAQLQLVDRSRDVDAHGRDHRKAA
jgi:hypothetical protein